MTNRLQAAQCILFDLDGTLTDPRVGITRSVAYALRDFGIETEDLDTLCLSLIHISKPSRWRSAGGPIPG